MDSLPARRMTELQRECRKRKLWPGGDQPNLKDRLIRYDCFRTSLHKVEIEQEPEAPGLPDYYEVIAEPIDLGMIKKKAEKKLYKTLDLFEKDLQLLIANARGYVAACGAMGNARDGPEIAAVEHVIHMELTDVREQAQDAAEHNQRMQQAVEARDRKRAESARQTLLELLDALEELKDPSDNRQHAKPFMRLPSKKKEPEYYAKIAKPVDLTTVREEIESGKIEQSNSLERKLLRMFANARSWFGEGSVELADADGNRLSAEAASPAAADELGAGLAWQPHHRQGRRPDRGACVVCDVLSRWGSHGAARGEAAAGSHR